MFDLITGRARHMPRHPAVTILLSTAAQLAAVGLVAVGSLLVVTDQVPAIPSMMAFVAAAPPPAPPPPPPPPPPPAPRAAQRAARPVPTTGAPVVPVEAPSRIEPEVGFDSDEEGVPGGVEGGVPEGVLGGIVGGLPDDVPPPPPPPPPAAPRGPVRIGGQIKMPALVHRVEPVYPQLALSAQLEGIVILEAIVDEEGRVTTVKVLRSNGVLDRPAMDAVRQWRYSPVILNGRPEKFILTVVVSFTLQK